MKPWREVAVPHPDVLEGTFLQSEFAADITAVRTGKATREYQDPGAFFRRTYITEGMRLLLIQVAQRLNGKGGEPVIQLQTAFGGGKTHTMLAVYHLTTRKCPLGELAGIPALVDQAGLTDVPVSRVAVLDGNAHAPGQPWKHGKQGIRTLWGELAWQLGGEEGLASVAESDASGTSPGKEVLKTLLEAYAPCVILIDELVAYVRQFQEGQPLSGGSFDSNLSFVQALTEATKQVPNAIVLGSLPESEVEAGSQRGVAALRALEKAFGRVQALWKPVATEEAFEIVRRRLFEPVRDEKARETVCRAFADAYVAEGSKLPTETQEGRYFNRLLQAYPIHPEVFDRLYEDWTTIDGFQRTRGVLKLMAKVIHRLWKDDNKDLMIMPGSLPLYDSSSRNELTYYLTPGWDAVVEKDIDGERAETTELENKEPRFGTVGAARRVARTIFLGSAPSSVATKTGNRGIDRARVLLGCFQPGQTSATYSDALTRLADRLHYLNSSGDKVQDATRYWFDTRANLRREMEDRKKRFEDKNEVRAKMAEALKKITGGATFFDGVHIFTSHADVPDDSALRLVLLPPELFYTREEPRLAFDGVLDYVRNNGKKPRYRGNRLIFLAPDHGSLARLRDCVRVALAWGSIVEDAAERRLVLDTLQEDKAKKELQSAEDVLPRVTRECYKWLLCPSQGSATEAKPSVEAFPLNTSGSGLGSEVQRVCIENELVIAAWSPIHLRTKLKELYWKTDKLAVGAMAFWEDSTRYLYLSRLRDRDVLAQAIIKGAASRDFFGTAYGQHEGRYDGFKLGDANVQLDDTLLLIEPDAAQQYEAARKTSTPAPAPGAPVAGITGSKPPPRKTPSPFPGVTTAAAPKARSFHVTAEVNAATAKMRLVQIAEEVIGVLASDPQATIRVTVEIDAEFPAGAADYVKRAVSENVTSLGGFKNPSWNERRGRRHDLQGGLAYERARRDQGVWPRDGEEEGGAMTPEQKLTNRITKRLRVLRAVYELVDGGRHSACSPAEIAQHANIEASEIDATLVYLQDEGLLNHMAEEYVEITHQGIVEYEAALKALPEGTDHFPATVIYNVTATNIGAIVSGNENTTSIQQQHNQGASMDQLGPLLDKLAHHVQALDGDDQAEASTALARVRREVAKPTPEWVKVTASLKYLESFAKLAGIVKTILALFTGTAA